MPSHDEPVTTVQQEGTGGTPAQIVPPGVVVRHSGGSFETIADPGVANRVLTSNLTGDASWQPVELSGGLTTGIADHSRLRANGGMLDAYLPDIADLRDYDGVRPWQTSLGVVVTNGSKSCTNLSVPWTTAVAGMTLIVKNDASTSLFVTTIDSVNPSTHVATLHDNAPFSVSGAGQRAQWGLDMEAAINAALVAVAALSTGQVRQVRLPGFYRASQIILPRGVEIVGNGWGYNIPTPGGIGNLGAGTWPGTWLQQIPGAEKNFVILEKYLDGGASRNWAGLGGMRNLMLIGPEKSVSGKSWTTGSGFAAVASDGDKLTILDGFFLDQIYATGFPQDGFYFPDGGEPLLGLNRLRPFFNGRYGINIEVRTDNAGSTGGNSPSTHLIDCSGDGNAEGCVRFANFSKYATIVVTNLKSEKADFNDTGSAGHRQENAIILEDCDDTPVVINGVTHISSVADVAGGGTLGSGDHKQAPGPTILVKSATDKRPKISARGVSCRLIGDETANTANAVLLRDSVIGVDVPPGTPNFDWPPQNQPGSDDVLTTGESTSPRGRAASTTTLSDGVLRGTLFTCKKTEAITVIRAACSTARTGAATLIKAALWTVDPATGDLACVAVSANTTAGLGSAPAVSDFTVLSYKKLAGRRYAVTLLVKTVNTPPAISAENATISAITAEEPRQCFGLSGRTDVTVADTISAATLATANTANRPYFELIP